MQQHSVRRLSCRCGPQRNLVLNLVSEIDDKGRIYRIKDSKASSGVAGASSRRPDAMREKRSQGRVTTEISVEDEIVHLRVSSQRSARAVAERVAKTSARKNQTYQKKSK